MASAVSGTERSNTERGDDERRGTAASAAPGLTDALLRPVRGHHAFEACVERLAGTIRFGVFPRGGTLPPERELAERLGVSRTTLREAMIALRTAGMVRTVRGRGGGTVVCYSPDQPSEQSSLDVAPRRVELMDSLTFRRIVEPGACQVAAGRDLSDSEIELLSGALDEVNAAQDDRNLHRQADSRLHLAIASVSGSAMIIDAVANVQARLHEMLTAIPVLNRNIDHSTHQHTSIVRAILKGDPRTARRVMEQHCDDTAALLHGLLA